MTLLARVSDPDLKPIRDLGAKAGRNQLNDIVAIIFSIAGALAFLFVVIGGLRYILSRGNPEGVAKAKSTIIYALVGLLITIAAYSIITFVLNNA